MSVSAQQLARDFQAGIEGKHLWDTRVCHKRLRNPHLVEIHKRQGWSSTVKAQLSKRPDNAD